MFERFVASFYTYPESIPKMCDRLYGYGTVTSRLHLHARGLRFEHPQSRQTLHLQAETPF